MRKVLFLLVAIILVVSLGVLGCAAPKQTTPSAPSVSQTQKQDFPWDGCFKKADGSPCRVYFITEQAANVTMSIHTKHLKGVIERGGGEFVLLNCEQDVARQSAMLEDAVLAHPDAIVLHPAQPPTTIPYIEDGTKKGIAFFISMMPPIVEGELQQDIVAYVGNYQLKRGPIQGQYILDWAKKLGRPIKVGEMWGLYGFEEFSGPVHRTLHDVVRDGHPTVSDNPVIAEWNDWGDTMFTEDKSYTVCLNGLTAHPDTDLIYCECDCMTGGVIAALKAMDRYYPAGQSKHVEVVTGDAEDWSLAEVEKGYIGCQVDMNIDRYTDGLAKAIWWHVVKGKSMDEVNTSFGRSGPGFDLGTSSRNIDVDDSLVTIDNVKEVRAKWANLGTDYSNWPCIQDEKFIKYPTQ